MKKILLLIFILFFFACKPETKEKLFVANEESGSISVIDAVLFKEIDRVSLSQGATSYQPHNVQTEGNLVLATANVAHEKESEMHENMEEMTAHGMTIVRAHSGEKSEEHADQLIIIDASSHKIADRIDLEAEAHLAHVVSDGKNAYITATDTEKLYVVDLKTKARSSIKLPEGSMPHGLRLTVDKKTAVIAGIGNALLIVDLETKETEEIKLPGKGVQTAVVNGMALVSIYDTKQIGIYDLTTKQSSFIDLPEAKGPIQLYPTPDGKYIYVADQGVYFDQPSGRNLYKIDLAKKKIVNIIDAGNAPHGLVVSPEGRVWATNLNGNSVTIIQNDLKTAEIPVGKAPNGITYWTAQR